MSIDEFIKRIDSVQSALIAAAPSIAEKMAISAKSLIQDRIQEKEGIPDASYSPLYASYKQKTIGYAKPFVDLTFSGHMWRNINVVEVLRKGNLTVAVLGGMTDTAQARLTKNTEKYGEFLTLKEEEKREVSQVALDECSRIVKQYL